MVEQGKSGKPLGSSSSGTLRLFFAFGAGIIGIFYLIMFVVPLASGHLEFRATATDMVTIERDGFPAADYLSVEGGNIVFSHARAWVSGNGEDRHLFQLTAPVVSDEQLVAWSAGVPVREPLDLSGLRLVVVFTGEQVKELWPEVYREAVVEAPLPNIPAKMLLTGDTEIAKGQISLPTFSSTRSRNLDWSNVRRLRYGVHDFGPLKLLKNLAIAVALLAISFFTFRYHRRHPTKPSPSGLDMTPALDEVLDL
jgi:hypothetical protein